MMNISPEILRFTIQLFCIATMTAMGLGISLQDIQSPFRKPLALALIVLVNNILAPLLGFFIIVIPDILQGGFFEDLAKAIVPLDDGHQIGFLLLLLASGSLAGPLLAWVAGAKADFARGLMVVLVGATAILMPFQLELLYKQTKLLPASVSFESGAVFMTLLVYQLLPLAIGILIGMQSALLAQLLKPLLVQLSTLTFLVLLAMIVLSGMAMISLPENPPLAEEHIATTTVKPDDLEATSLSAAKILQGVTDKLQDVENRIDANKLLAHSDTEVTSTVEADVWVIYDASTTVNIEFVPSTLTITVPGATTSPTITNNGVNDRIQELKDEQISTALSEEVNSTDDFSLTANYLVVGIEKGQAWRLADRETTFFVKVEPAKDEPEYILDIYQKLPEPLGILADFLKTLQGLPIIGPVIDFITQILIVLIPYALLLAISMLLLEAGRLTGTAVRGMVGASGACIPATVATATAVRNVSMALIVIANYLLHDRTQSELITLGNSALGMVMVFYIINLIVAARQAAKWGSGEESVETAVSPPES